MQPEHVEWVINKTFYIYVFGIVTYDIPGGEGKTEFCYIYEPSSGHFNTYSEGNYAK